MTETTNETPVWVSVGRTVTDLMAETMSNRGAQSVFGMLGHSNLGPSDAIRRQIAE